MDARTSSDGALAPERESALLQSAQRGDPAALYELLRAHQRLLWRLCFALTAHRGEAEQMLTETARRAVRQLAQAPVGQPLAPWLAGLARTFAHARARRRAAGEVAATPPTRPSGEAWESGVLGPLAVPFEQKLLAQYCALSPDEQTLLALRLLERMSYGEIAAFLELPLTAVMHRIAALRERLNGAPAAPAVVDDRMRHLSMQQMSASLDGALVGVAMEMVAKHLATCRECRERHAKLSRQDETLRRMLAWEPAPEAREDMAIRIESILGAEMRGAAPAPTRAATSVPTPKPAPAPVPAPAPAPAPAPEPLAPPAPQPRAIAPQPAPAPAPAPTPAPLPTPAPEPVVHVRATRPSRRRHAIAVAATLACVALALVASLVLPPVIRVSVPELPQPRVPRIVLVHTPPARVTTVPTPQHATQPAPANTPAPAVTAPAPASSPAPPPASHPAPASHVTAAPAVRPAPPAPIARITPPARPAPRSAPASAPAVAPAKGAEPDASANWPLLCGEVLDDHGQPVAGARVALADLDLTARTDRRGHFCIAAPVGDRTLSVIAQGFTTFRTVVDLGAQGQELHVSLDPAH